MFRKKMAIGTHTTLPKNWDDLSVDEQRAWVNTLLRGMSPNPEVRATAGRKATPKKKSADDGVETKAKRTGASTPAKPSERISGSSKNPKRSAASTSSGRGIEVNEATLATLKNKVKEHNAKMEEQGKPAHTRASLGALKAVYRRGAGAFSTSHRPGKTRGQWAFARVNAFLHLLSTGSPKNPKYVTDNDLLPKGHPKKGGSKSLIERATKREF